MVEFVSANPTGPLHVGHGRQAALGDALAALLQSQGYQVSREFYYNDAGVQIQNLALSVQARARGIKPGEPGWPEAAYNGEYIQDIADDFLAKKTVHAFDGEAVKASGKVDDLDAMRRFAVTYLRHEQDLDLQKFGVRFDVYYLESSLYTDGKVETTVNALIASGKTYEKDGALWLRTTEYGDDKDRVMRKSDGTYTYFVPDVAYHVTKWQRGFRDAINVQGTDHHGTIARVRAGLQALSMGIPKGYPDYILHKMVRVMRGGEEVKISKRAGSYVTVRDLIEWVGRDAVRFFLVSRTRRFGVRVRHRSGAVAERRESGVLRAVRARARLQRVPAAAGERSHARARGRRAQRRAVERAAREGADPSRHLLSGAAGNRGARAGAASARALPARSRRRLPHLLQRAHVHRRRRRPAQRAPESGRRDPAGARERPEAARRVGAGERCKWRATTSTRSARSRRRRAACRASQASSSDSRSGSRSRSACTCSIAGRRRASRRNHRR